MTGLTTEQILGVKIDIGVEADKFLKSDCGLSLVDRQRNEIAGFHTLLEDPSLPVEKIREYQLEIAARRRALDWLLEMVDEAKQAFEQSELIETED